MALVQTSIVAGMDHICISKIRAHIVLRDEIAGKVIRLSRDLERPMTHIVGDAIDLYIKQTVQKGGEYDKQRSMLV